MSFNRSGYIGRAPGDSAITIAKQYFQPTGVQTDFTFSSGYSPGLVDVYRNGVKLINVLDYAATDGSTISLDSPVGVGSTVQVVAYKAFNLATVKATELDTTVTGTDLTLGGDLTVSDLITTVDINVSGSATISGTVVAGSFSGDGSNLTGLATTETVRADTLTVAGVSTFTGAVDSNATTDSTSSTTGAITAAGGVGIAKDLFVGDAIDVTKDLKVGAAATITGALTGSTGTFSGAVNIDATTDSTSATTGALIVDGGLGVAKNVYIGAGLSVAGTLTYEDVTNVDSVGLITAKSGVNVSGGQLIVGSGLTIGNAGVATFADGSATANGLHFGSGGDLKLYHTGSQSFLKNTTGGLFIDNTANISLRVNDGEDGVQVVANGAVELYYNSGKTLETTANGVTIYDDGKDDEARLIVQGGEGSPATLYLYADDGDDNGDKHRILADNSASDLYIQNYASGSWESSLRAVANGAVSLYYDNSVKFATTNDGTVTTGIGTFSNGIVIPDDKIVKFGTGEDLQISHTSSDNDGRIKYQNENGHLRILSGVSGNGGIKLNNRTDNAAYIHCDSEGAVKSYYNNSLRLSTTNEGIEVTGFTSTTAGMGVTGGLFEGSFIKAGKLSDNATLGISTANFFYFTTQETTTATPNIVWNDSYSLSSKMAVGDVASVTVVTTAAAGGYAANWTIDGNAVTEEWVGGSAPSAGGSDGLDIYSFTIIKTGTGTGDSGFKVIANVSNAT
jgi:hypothetical protein